MQHVNRCATPEALISLNRDCFCLTLDNAALTDALEKTLGVPGLAPLTRERCPYMFAAHPIFVADHHLQRMHAIIHAVETVVNSSAWRDRVLDSAPAIARHDPGGVKSVFMGYDFHLGPTSPGLIEINTNAGGAMLNAALAYAQRACCKEMTGFIPSATVMAQFEQNILTMFQREWRGANRLGPLANIAIVDEQPTEQYLYPEFVLFKALFQRHGINAVIVSPEQLMYKGGTLWVEDVAIDLVYNRLTDFMLQQPAAAALREAYLDNAVVLTPHPQAYTLYADKRNLALLTDPQELAALKVEGDIQEVLLSGIPRTEIVDTAHADRLWAQRKELFFKPATGYGSKAAWRGAKLTKRVWGEILAGDYVAQTLIPPGERHTVGGLDPLVFKYDLRHYVYDGTVQWMAARLYQGQTTNFRTPGGGFAPVYRCHEHSADFKTIMKIDVG